LTTTRPSRPITSTIALRRSSLSIGSPASEQVPGFHRRTRKVVDFKDQQTFYHPLLFTIYVFVCQKGVLPWLGFRNEPYASGDEDNDRRHQEEPSEHGAACGGNPNENILFGAPAAKLWPEAGKGIRKTKKRRNFARQTNSITSLASEFGCGDGPAGVVWFFLLIFFLSFI
jgi:hypothetical protein